MLHPHVRLSANHHRAIGTTLAILDEMLSHFEQWAHGRELRGVLYRESNRLTQAQRKSLLNCILVLRQDLRTLAKDVGLEAKVQDVASAIWSQSSGFWDAIVELEPKYLRRYGELPEESATYLKQKVAELAAHLQELTGCLGRGERAKARPSQRRPVNGR